MSATTEEPQLTDEQILEYEQKIKDEVAQKVPLVCQEEPIENLAKEFEDNKPFLRKIENLNKDCDKIRRCRGDGNCFFRAFAFAWYESTMISMKNGIESLYELRLKILEDSSKSLERYGFEKLAFEDFYDVALDEFKLLKERHNDPDMLLVDFQTDETSNSIIMLFRFIASAYLRSKSEEYEPFLIDEMISIEEFCTMHVEAFGRESEDLQIIALSKAMDVPIQVVYLDGGVDDRAAVHEFWPAEEDEKSKTKKPIKLIYRPGHYDILYDRD